MLLGEYEQRIDDKHRLTIPARLRERFADGLFLTRGLDACVTVYPRETFDAFVQREMARLDPMTREGRQMQRFVYASTVHAELDRQGRVQLPASLMEHASLTREVVVAGISDRLEVWDREAWQTGFAAFEGSVSDVAERLARETDR